MSLFSDDSIENHGEPFWLRAWEAENVRSMLDIMTKRMDSPETWADHPVQIKHKVIFSKMFDIASRIKPINQVLTSEVAKDFVDHAQHDFECLLAASRLYDSICREAKICNEVLGTCDIYGDVVRHKAKLYHISEKKAEELVYRMSLVERFQALVKIRDVGPLATDFFAQGKRRIYEQFDDMLWRDRLYIPAIRAYERHIDRFKLICKHFLEQSFTIEELVNRHFLPEIYQDPLMYTEYSGNYNREQKDYICNLARRLVAGE